MCRPLEPTRCARSERRDPRGRAELLARRARVAGRVPGRRRGLLPRVRRARWSVRAARVADRRLGLQRQHRALARTSVTAALPPRLEAFLRAALARRRSLHVQRAGLGLSRCSTRSTARSCPPTASPGACRAASTSGSTPATRSAGRTTRRSSWSTTAWPSSAASTSRWAAGTRRAHRADDPRRRDSKGEPFPPVHDVQMMVEGAGRGRDRRAGARALAVRRPGRRLRPRAQGGRSVARRRRAGRSSDVDVAIARTAPGVRRAARGARGRAAVRRRDPRARAAGSTSRTST